MSRDPLQSLAVCRVQLAANKARDFAAERGWKPMPPEARDLATGALLRPETREQFNARQRAFERNHDLLPRYRMARDRAMRPTIGQLRMIEAAIRCDVTCRDAVAAWRAAA